MNILFAGRAYEGLGVEYLSAALKKKGFNTELIFDPGLFNNMFISNNFLDGFFSFEKKIIKKILAKKNIIMVLFSVTTVDYPWACRLASAIKNIHGSVPVVFGGIHASSVPEKVILTDCVDYVCVGEGEEAVVDLATAVMSRQKTENIANIWTKRNGQIIKNPPRPLITDLDRLPFPDKELFHREFHGFSSRDYTLITGRGCAYQCTYCYAGYLRKLYEGKGPFFRKRSVHNVIEELKRAKRAYGMKMVTFFDDALTADREWFSDFAAAYEREIKLPSFCFLHPEHVDEQLIEGLKRIRAKAVNMGIQTVDEEYRRSVLLRFESNEVISRAMRLLGQTDIFLYVDILLGLPGQGKKSLLDTALFLNKHRPDAVFAAWLTYFPNLPIKKKTDALPSNKGERLEFLKFSDDIYYNYSKKLSSLANLILISPALPKWLLALLIRLKIYIFFPPLRYSFSPTGWAGLYFQTLVRRVVTAKKSTIIANFRGAIYYYGSYIKRFFTREVY